MSRLVLFNKPFAVLSQFTSEQGHQTLANFIDVAGVYPAGRLDKDSEGLLVLTDDGKLQNKISSPKHRLAKNYWAQVEGIPTEDQLTKIRSGLMLKDGMTLPAEVKLLPEPDVWARQPPIRERKHIPTCWLEIIIREGRNRQVRRMTAAIGHPTLRLIRYAVGSWSLDGIAPGRYRQFNI